jgi:hypothetical protein
MLALVDRVETSNTNCNAFGAYSRIRFGHIKGKKILYSTKKLIFKLDLGKIFKHA